MHFPKVKFNSKTDRIYQTCENKFCIDRDHLKVRKIDTLDLEYVYKRLLKGSIRQESKEDGTLGCLVWKGKPTSQGYGRIGIYGRTHKVHIMALFVKLKITTLPTNDEGERFMTLHGCKNKNC